MAVSLPISLCGGTWVVWFQRGTKETLTLHETAEPRKKGALWEMITSLQLALQQVYISCWWSSAVHCCCRYSFSRPRPIPRARPISGPISRCSSRQRLGQLVYDPLPRHLEMKWQREHPLHVCTCTYVCSQRLRDELVGGEVSWGFQEERRKPVVWMHQVLTVGRRKIQNSAKERNLPQKNANKKQAKERKRVQRAYDCKQPGLKRPGFGTSKGWAIDWSMRVQRRIWQWWLWDKDREIVSDTEDTDAEMRYRDHMRETMRPIEK